MIESVENAFGYGFVLGMVFGAALVSAGAMILWFNRQALRMQGRRR